MWKKFISRTTILLPGRVCRVSCAREELNAMHERKRKVDGPKEERTFCKQQRSKFTASGKKPLNSVVFVVGPNIQAKSKYVVPRVRKSAVEKRRLFRQGSGAEKRHPRPKRKIEKSHQKSKESSKSPPIQTLTCRNVE